MNLGLRGPADGKDNKCPSPVGPKLISRFPVTQAVDARKARHLAKGLQLCFTAHKLLVAVFI